MTVNENTGEKGLPGEKTDEKEIQKKLKNESAPAEKSQKNKKRMKRVKAKNFIL